MTEIINLSEDLPATITVHLARFDGAMLVAMANNISQALFDLGSEIPPVNPLLVQRLANERLALHSLFSVLRNHIANFHGEPYLCQVLDPQEDVA